MFALGFEENMTRFITGIKRSWGIAFFGALAPFLAAFSIIYAFWGSFNMALISGLAMTATAVSLTMVSLKSEGLERSDAATGIMTSAILDDVASLALVAILIPIAAGSTAPTLIDISWIVGKAIAFFAFVVLLAKWVLPHEISGIAKGLRVMDRWGAKQFVTFDSGDHAVLAILLFALLMGLLAHVLGFHPAVGAYMAGLILKGEYFDLTGSTPNQEFERIRGIVDNVAFSWIGPVFFVALGTKIIFDWDLLVSVLPQVFCLVIAILLAQISSAAIAARYTGHFPWPDSLMIGFGMLGRAELAFVVFDIAYVQQKIISTELFYTLMLTAFWLNVAVPVSIAWWKPYFIGEKSMGFLSARQ
ncbi:MAG: cation:proton antiporter [Acidimicrobiales bacterium]|nr:MAG: cation:proton antiporter [Acidimicrobiales bacterium]